jgi:hypothetical protein
VAGERQNLHLAGAQDPIWRLWSQLPESWRGPVIGDDVEGWESITENDDYRINLTGLPEVIQAELAWMAHWQAADGTRSSVLAISQLANILRKAIRDDRPFPPSIRQMDWETAAALQAWFYATRWRRFPPHGVRARLRVIFLFARTALIAACHDGHWWELDYWHPRCDQRIPLSEREPQAHYGCSPALITHPWFREAVKWYLGTMLESGALRWTTVSQERLRCLHRFDRWLAIAFDDPRQVLADPATTANHAVGYRTRADRRLFAPGWPMPTGGGDTQIVYSAAASCGSVGPLRSLCCGRRSAPLRPSPGVLRYRRCPSAAMAGRCAGAETAPSWRAFRRRS